MLGYVGADLAEDYKALKKKGYQASDSIGQSGIERTYDTYLRGKDGTAQLTVDSRGRPKTAAVPKQPSTPGETLRLTLDINLQRAAERALTYGINLAHIEHRGRVRRRRRDRRARPARTAPSSRWRRTRRTSRRSSRAART